MTEMLHSTPRLPDVLDGPWWAAVPNPVLALDCAGTIVGVNLPAAQLLAMSSDSIVGRHFESIALSDLFHGAFADVLEHVCAGSAWLGRLPLVTAPEAHLQVSPVEEGGRTIGAVVIIDSVGRELGRSTLVAERLNRLARVATELQSVGDLEGLTSAVVSHMADAAGATTASLSVLLDEHTLGLVGLRGGTSDARTRWATYPADDTNPAGAAVLAGRPVLLAGREEMESRFPDLELSASGERSLLCLPLMIESRTVGVITLSFPGVLDADDTELEFFQIMADTCGQALERIRAVETAEQQNAKLSYLAAASAELASSLDYESTLRKVARLAVPDMADWCAISLAQDGTLRTLAVAHRDPAKVQLALEFQQRFPPDPKSNTGGYEVLRTGKSLLIPEVTDEMLVASAKSEEHLAMLRELALHSGLTVPLTADGRVLGTITWVNGETGRRFTEDDIPFAEDLGRRAGIAIDNAMLHSELREVADRLQEAVRPAAIPELPGWRIGATYSSAGRASVGGDFYDVVPLSDGRTAFVVGDVMGRGVSAAAAMTQVRAALRALIAVDPDPRTVMTRLDLLYERFPSDQLVTLVYALADPELDQLVVSSAGHPAPLLVGADGAQFLHAARGTIIGADAAARQAIVVPFLPGDTLVMYTDGLLERRDEDLAQGEDRLLATYTRHGVEPTDTDLARLVELMRDQSRDDDVAVVAARRLSDSLPA